MYISGGVSWMGRCYDIPARDLRRGVSVASWFCFGIQRAPALVGSCMIGFDVVFYATVDVDRSLRDSWLFSSPAHGHDPIACLS